MAVICSQTPKRLALLNARRAWVFDMLTVTWTTYTPQRVEIEARVLGTDVPQPGEYVFLVSRHHQGTTSSDAARVERWECDGATSEIFLACRPAPPGVLGREPWDDRPLDPNFYAVQADYWDERGDGEYAAHLRRFADAIM
jgi:hypothetical protein